MIDPVIRNFSIIAHIDHGKTTLTDRLLLKTGTIEARGFHERMLDDNPIEQERGVTIKLTPVRMKYELPERLKQQYLTSEAILNLIDTPGHVDFGYEVSRSLQAGEGAVLLVDATQGVQAQTLSNYQKAVDLGLTIIPVLNKVDLASVDVDRAMLEMMELFDFKEDEIIAVSAKTGLGVDRLLEAIVERLPAPTQNIDKPLRALAFSSQYDSHKGVVVYARVVDGVLSKENLKFYEAKASFYPSEVGIFTPEMKPKDKLVAGEVGYIATGMKEMTLAQIGDTIVREEETGIMALPGYKPPQLMVFMDFYPVDGDDFANLKLAMEKLKLNDSALQFVATHSLALGNGLRVGFLGIFHAEIVQERLEREFNLELIATSPSVRYEVKLKQDKLIEVMSPTDLPDPTEIEEIREPLAKVTLFSPQEYLGAVLALAENHRGKQEGLYFYGDRVKLTYEIPLPELITTFFDELKSVSSGFASMEYELAGYSKVEAVKLSILINKESVEALAQIVVKDKAEEQGRYLAKKLKEVIPRQLFEIPIQATIGGKIVARETIKAFRKDVTAKLYGGDRTRRLKLLEKQKKGKERRKQFGQVEIPQEAFMAVLKRE